MEAFLNRLLAMLGLAVTLSGCVGGSYVRSPEMRGADPPTPPVTRPQIMRDTGGDDLVGQHAVALLRRFGEARIDLREGDARKLQFASERCVLDVFLYPQHTGGTPVATHIEARRRQGGGAIDRRQCIAELERAVRGR